MPYIGRAATNTGSVRYLDNIASGFDGSDTTFTAQVGGVNITPDQENVEIYLDGVFQHPGSGNAYTISGSTITFTEAPVANTVFTGYVVGAGAYLDDKAVSSAKLDDDAVTAAKLDDDGTGFQVGDLGVGGSLTSGDKLTVTGRARVSGGIIGDLTGDVTGTASIATTVTITDNESTNEDNAVIFTAGGDVDGGNLGLESDGNLTYNPSTGRLTATQLAGTLQTAAQTNITSVGTLATAHIQGGQAYASSATNLSTTVSKKALRVQGSSDASTSLWMGSLANDAQQYIQACNSAGDGADDIVLNPFGGKVGINIGNASPTTKLQIKADSTEEDVILLEDNSGTDIGAIRIHGGAFMMKGKSASAPIQLQTHDGNEDIEVDPDGFIKFETAGSERMRIGSTGRVRIGASDSDAILRLRQDSAETSPGTNDGTCLYLTGYNANDKYGGGIGWNWNDCGTGVHPTCWIGTHSQSYSSYTKADLVFATRDATTNDAATERMRITSAGNVGIGCTPANGYPLEVLATSGNANLRVSATGSGQGARLFLRSHNTDSTYLSFNDSDDDTVLAQIRSYGTAHGTTAKRRGLALETAGTERILIDSSGNLKMTSTGSFEQRSHNYAGTTDTDGRCIRIVRQETGDFDGDITIYITTDNWKSCIYDIKTAGYEGSGHYSGGFYVNNGVHNHHAFENDYDGNVGSLSVIQYDSSNYPHRIKINIPLSADYTHPIIIAEFTIGGAGVASIGDISMDIT